jgi:hypothetical protein
VEGAARIYLWWPPRGLDLAWCGTPARTGSDIARFRRSVLSSVSEQRREQIARILARFGVLTNWAIIGIAHGMEILRYNNARERTHLRLMRLHYCSGDRASALRQYERCAAVLEDEFGAAPAQSTVALYSQILADRIDDLPALQYSTLVLPLPQSHERFADVLNHIRQIAVALDSLQHELHKAIRLFEVIDSQ